MRIRAGGGGWGTGGLGATWKEPAFNQTRAAREEAFRDACASPLHPNELPIAPVARVDVDVVTGAHGPTGGRPNVPRLSRGSARAPVARTRSLS